MSEDEKLEEAIDRLYEAQANLALAKKAQTKADKMGHRVAARICLRKGMKAAGMVLEKLMRE
jgi:hypothetical protein